MDVDHAAAAAAAAPDPAPAAATAEKYDRQLRMWGAHGQKALMESRICLLNAGPTGTESALGAIKPAAPFRAHPPLPLSLAALKNLVLPGCGHNTIVDGALVTREDLANNFFVAPALLGQPRAKVRRAAAPPPLDPPRSTSTPRTLTPPRPRAPAPRRAPPRSRWSCCWR